LNGHIGLLSLLEEVAVLDADGVAWLLESLIAAVPHRR
jgi:hypothetical protein